jgi:hypothetical protein
VDYEKRQSPKKTPLSMRINWTALMRHNTDESSDLASLLCNNKRVDSEFGSQSISPLSELKSPRISPLTMTGYNNKNQSNLITPQLLPSINSQLHSTDSKYSFASWMPDRNTPQDSPTLPYSPPLRGIMHSTSSSNSNTTQTAAIRGEEDKEMAETKDLEQSDTCTT